ncbi:MAG: sulfide/dihydroorotate dehydrogenase-like FAD/NAD-binding protein [Clostridia bacterium]|nr:sulfide/dihydroorotate dehydrogenase-like FAD/NAD-binding protein [Clostridia bacterium]
MFRIETKEVLNDTIYRMGIVSPRVAKKARPGQFIMLRVDEAGERIPLTIAGTDPEKGIVDIIFQAYGTTTKKLCEKEAGDEIADFVGPLGKPTEIRGQKICVIGGGVGCAIALPIAREYASVGADVTCIIGFRSKNMVILEDEFRSFSRRVFVMTDDGSYGSTGNVCMPLKEMLEKGEDFDRIIAIGPLVMMRFVTETARPWGVPVSVSMNPIMIDGTGMCGGCRMTLKDEYGRPATVFACVDGPEFDGYQVDFDEVMTRGRMYADFERHSYEKTCNLFRAADQAKKEGC